MLNELLIEKTIESKLIKLYKKKKGNVNGCP